MGLQWAPDDMQQKTDAAGFVSTFRVEPNRTWTDGRSVGYFPPSNEGAGPRDGLCMLLYLDLGPEAAVVESLFVDCDQNYPYWCQAGSDTGREPSGIKQAVM